MTSTEAQIAGFFAKYEPTTAKLGKAVRARLRARLPGLLELVYVYERQDSLVFSYSTSEAGANGVCAVAIYPDRVNLCFTGGAQLSKADPERLLRGTGKTVRHVELKSVDDYDRDAIERLIATSVKLAKVRLDPKATGAVILKATEQKQRALRAAKAAPRGPAPRRPKPRG